jgi:hypothetical protein
VQPYFGDDRRRELDDFPPSAFSPSDSLTVALVSHHFENFFSGSATAPQPASMES